MVGQKFLAGFLLLLMYPNVRLCTLVHIIRSSLIPWWWRGYSWKLSARKRILCRQCYQSESGRSLPSSLCYSKQNVGCISTKVWFLLISNILFQYGIRTITQKDKVLLEKVQRRFTRLFGDLRFMRFTDRLDVLKLDLRGKASSFGFNWTFQNDSRVFCHTSIEFLQVGK